MNGPNTGLSAFVISSDCDSSLAEAQMHDNIHCEPYRL